MSKEEKRKVPEPAEMECVVIGDESAGASSIFGTQSYVFSKSEASGQIGGGNSSLSWKICPNDLELMESLVLNSSILPQCIRAYADNVAGFGIDVRARENVDETDPAVQAELARCREAIERLSDEADPKSLFQNMIQDRETYGTAYMEVIRDASGQVVQLFNVTNPKTVTRSVKDDDPTDYVIYRNGKAFEAKRKFCRFRQQSGGKTVYFKEFGDPRDLNKRTGNYEEGLDIGDQANELIDFRIGVKPYGTVRWGGVALSISGAYRAERLNNNYFRNGRHTPLMMIFENGTLTPESMREFTQYMSSVKGEEGQFKFLLMFMKSAESANQFEETGNTRPNVQIKDLAGILQNDELFQDYIDNNRKKVQSAFMLPDLYTGHTTDFNRATAQTAMTVTEQQVFQPMRRELAWELNNKILGAYGFTQVEAYFREPDISNPEDLYNILSVINSAGGLTPNKALDILSRQLGEPTTPFTESWADTPLPVQQINQPAASFSFPTASDGGDVLENQEIQKSAGVTNEEIASLLKGTQDVLLEVKSRFGDA